MLHHPSPWFFPHCRKRPQCVWNSLWVELPWYRLCPPLQLPGRSWLWGGGVLGGFWMVFLGGTGGERESARSRWAWSVFTGRHSFLNSPIFLCYILYIEQWGFRYIKFQNIVKSTLDLDALGRHVHCSSVDNSTTSSIHWRQWRDCCTSFRHGLHGVVGMVSYTNTVFVTCYFCYMFSLGSSSGSTGSVRIYRSVCERHTSYIYRCIPT